RRAQKEGRLMTSVAPFGYKKLYDAKNKPIFVPGDNADHVRWIFNEVVINDGENINSIRKYLESNGVKIYRSNIYKMLRNPFYMGKIFVKAYEDEPAKLYEGIHEGLISEELFYKIQEILERKNKKCIKSVKIPEAFFLKGFLICKQCGKTLRASTSSGNGGKYSYYHCSGGCGERIKVEEANKQLLDALKRITIRDEVLELFQLILEETYGKDKVERVNKIAEIEQRRQEIEKQQLDIDYQFYVAKKMPEDSYIRLKGSFDKTLALLSSKKYDLEIGNNSLNTAPKLDNNILSNLPKFFTAAAVEQKREIISSIISEKIIFDENKGRTIKLNSVIELLTNHSNGFMTRGINKPLQKSDLFPRVEVPGVEPGSEITFL
ncbi:MAG: recombinase family protein, partial [Ignavibacteria bacterium]|nr:recombinase family protein [Ignavibacteria bacterium]